MKHRLFVACLALSVAGCNNTQDSGKPSADSAAAAASSTSTAVTMPYELAKPYSDWQPGKREHVATFMKGLKGFETGDLAACVASFGDSVQLNMDGFRAKLSNDSLKAVFTHERSMYKDFTVTMQDYESVISKDGKEEWVTLWYKQRWTDQQGKADSMNIVNDGKIENGKVVVLDEKVQHYSK